MTKSIHIIAALLLLPALCFSQKNVAESTNGATATASSTYATLSGTYDPMEAIDGLNNSPRGWLSADTTMPEWLEVTFLEWYTIDSMLVNFEPKNYNQTYNLEYWDGDSWELIVEVGPTEDVEATFKFPPVRTNKVRYYCTVGNVNGYAFVEELRVFGDSLTSGIENQNLVSLSPVTLYPNPSLEQVNIDLGNLTDVSVKAYNQNGQLVYHEERVFGKHQFDLDGAPGLYMILVSFEEETRKFKLIKE